MIKAKGLCKTYDDIVVLKDFDLEINTGETLVILGQSGVGKSVFLKHVNGLEKPDAGSLEIDGVTISDLSGPQLYKAIKNTGMLFQGGALFDSLTVIENTSFYLDQHGKVDPKEIENAIWVSREEMLEVFSGNSQFMYPARKGSIAHFMIKKWTMGDIQ